MNMRNIDKVCRKQLLPEGTGRRVVGKLSTTEVAGLGQPLRHH